MIITVICENCGVEFTGYSCPTSGRKRFCSIECRRSFPIEKRFWRFVNKKSNDECWEWMGCKNNRGYGQIVLNKIPQLSHRISWEIHFGKIPSEMFVCHSCDNPSCVNPKHLWIGTQLDNMRDRNKKGRNPNFRGDKGGNAKLSWDQVHEIRQRYIPWKVTTYQLANEYGVSSTEIVRIINYQYWIEE